MARPVPGAPPDDRGAADSAARRTAPDTAPALGTGAPHLVYLARCQEKLGRLVEAAEAYIKVTRESLDPDAPKAFRDAKVEAERELAAIEPRVPSVTVIVGGLGAAHVEVRLDGVVLPQALVGVKRPTNPGKHVCSATAPGSETVSVPIDLGEGGSETVRLELVPGKAARQARAARPMAGPSPAAQRALPGPVPGIPKTAASLVRGEPTPVGAKREAPRGQWALRALPAPRGRAA